MTDGASPASTSARRGGPPPALAFAALLGLVAGIVLILFGGSGGGAPAPTPTIPPVSAAGQQTAQLVTDTLGRSSIQVQQPQTPYRPAETPALFRVPRIVLQAIVPDDATHGYIVIYDLGSPNDADAVGREYAGYLASGVGRVQFPNGTQFVLRRVGSTLVFFSWTPGAGDDTAQSAIATGLATLGEGIAVPS